MVLEQGIINLTNIDHIYADLYLSSDEDIDVPAYVSMRVNGDTLYERKIGQTEAILICNVSIDVSTYEDYCTLEFRLNQTDIGFYDESISVYIDNIRTKIWHTYDTWNITLSNITQSYTLDTWNLTLSNTPQFYILDTWNITLSNTTQSYILDTWNLTLSNTAEGNILDKWNITLSNLTISSYILDIWNITLSNTPQPYILDTWNITLSNTTKAYTLDTWNLTIGNLTISPYILDRWNVTLSNLTISPYILDTWNLTLSNTSQAYILDTWNMTLSNLTISSYILDTWNITLSNTPQPYILDTWNVTLGNLTISSFIIDTWNMTLSNTTVIPDPPSGFTATAYSGTQINLAWAKGADADYTYIERNMTASWTRGAGIEIYNDTGINYEDTGLSTGITYYYQGWSWNTSNARWSTTYSSDDATTIGLTCSFIYDVTGSVVTVTPTITESTHYKWIVKNLAETEWIPIEDIHDQKFVFPLGGKYKITLTAKDDTSSVNYTRTVTVKASYVEPEPPAEEVEEEEEPRVRNIFTDTGLSDWFADRNIGEFVFIGITGFFILLVVFKRRRKKLVIYPVKKNKKDEEK